MESVGPSWTTTKLHSGEVQTRSYHMISLDISWLVKATGT